jgi:hypothetical protein
MAIAVPREREESAAYVEAFVKQVQSNGLLDQLTQKAGLRGAVNY